MTNPDPASAAPPQTPSAIANVPVMSSHDLLGTQGALQIDHKGAIYTLRATSKGGLILTK